MSEDINIGAITEALNDKTDRDMRNVDNAAGADAVIEYQLPTADNNYTWYRKYKSGWVEQGGFKQNVSGTVTVTFPKEMANNRYTIIKTLSTSSTGEHISYNQISFFSLSTTGANTATAGADFSWVVYGMAAQGA